MKRPSFKFMNICQKKKLNDINEKMNRHADIMRLLPSRKAALVFRI
jgi:hypothetical protein